MNTVLAFQSNDSLIPPTLFSLSMRTFILGRSSKCDLVVKHVTVSRRHSEITLTRRSTTVQDLGSRNGTFIDDKRIEKGELNAGQYVKFGSVTFLLTSLNAGNDDRDSEIETAKCLGPSVNNSLLALSRAQRRVLDLILQGLGVRKVAAQLNLSATTVHNHIQAIYRALGVHSRSELLVKVLAEKRKTVPVNE